MLRCSSKDATHLIHRRIRKLPLPLAVLLLLIRFLHANAPRLVFLFLRVSSPACHRRSIATDVTVASHTRLDVHLRVSASTRGRSACRRSTRSMNDGGASVHRTLVGPVGQLLLSALGVKHKYDCANAGGRGQCTAVQGALRPLRREVPLPPAQAASAPAAEKGRSSRPCLRTRGARRRRSALRRSRRALIRVQVGP